MCGLQPGGSMQLETKFPPPPRPSYDRLPLRRLASDLAGRLDQTPALLHRDDRPGQALNREAGDRAKGGSAGTPKFSDRPGGELHVVHSPPNSQYYTLLPRWPRASVGLYAFATTANLGSGQESGPSKDRSVALT